MNIDKFSPEQLRRGASIQEQIRELQEEYRRVMGGGIEPRKRKQLSAKARKIIAAKMKKIWEERKKSKGK